MISSIVPEGAAIRKAVKWISNMREEGNASLSTLIDKACVRFNLSPKECEFLSRFFSEAEKSKAQKS